MTDDTALSPEERAELERLRAEVAELRSQAAAAPVAAETPVAPPPRPRRQRWRSVVATLLIVIGCILAPISVVAVWTKNLVTDTDRYVATVAPLASDPAIQSAIADRITAETPVASPPRPRRQRWRSVVATLLIVIGCILAPISVVAVWTKNLVTDTDRYVATVAPLASDPAIQSAIADRITAEIFTKLDVTGITNQAVDALAERGLPPLVATQLHALSEPLSNGVESFVRTEVGKVVASEAFANAWTTANRTAHQALVAALTGETREGITIENDTVSINLGPIIQEVKQRLIDRGFGLASRIPNVNPSFVLVQSDYIAKARGAFNLLNAIGNWLPVVALFFLAIGIYVAKGHRRALVGVGLGLAGGMLVLGLGLALFRTIYLDALPLGVLTRDAAAVFYDTLVRFLRLGLRSVLVFGLIIALAGFLTGRSVTAVRARAGLTKGIGWLRGGAEQAGFRTGPVGAWVYTYKRVLWIAVIAIAALVLVFWDQPTGRVIVGITLGVLVALVIIEFLGRPPGPAVPELSEPEPPVGADLDNVSATASVTSTPTASVTSSPTDDATETNVRG